MKIAVIGAGAIGSFVAGQFAKNGGDRHEILLVGREDQVDAINQKGLCIKSADSQETIQVKAGTRLDKEYELVIFAVKSQDLEQAYQDNHSFLEECCILTTQNGVQADNLLSSHFDPRKMISSIVMFGATYIHPGEVTLNFPGDWILGNPFTANDPRLHKIVEIFSALFDDPFKVTATPDITGMKWLKLFVNFNNCIPALIGQSMQETFSDIDFCHLSILLLKEGVEIIQNAGIELVSLPQFPAERIYGLAAMPQEQAAGIIQKTLTTLSERPLFGSILQSIKRHKPSEIDFINGEVTQIARNISMSSPLNRKVVDMVHQVEQEGKFFDAEEIKKEFDLV